jgi:hypothetical protein
MLPTINGNQFTKPPINAKTAPPVLAGAITILGGQTPPNSTFGAKKIFIFIFIKIIT